MLLVTKLSFGVQFVQFSICFLFVVFRVNTPHNNRVYRAGNSSSAAAAAKIKVAGVLIKLPGQRLSASNTAVVVVVVVGDICCAGNTLCRC